MPKAKSASRERYELNADAIAALRAALAADPEKLQRLEERLAHHKEQAARRTALERKIALLKSRNAALRAATQPAPRRVSVSSDSPMASSTSSTSPGNTVSPHDSTLTRVALDGPTRGPSPSIPAAPSPTSGVSTARSSQAAAADDFDENSINKDAPPVPDTWGSERSVFRYAGPTVKGMVSSVMKDGVLYRIITDKGEWAFYNDTRYYSVQVRYRLLGGSVVTPGPSVEVTAVAGDQELSVEVGPEETKVLLKGRVVDFENLSTATLLPKKAATAAEERILCREPQTDWKVITAANPRVAAIARASSSSPATTGQTSTAAVTQATSSEELLAFCMDRHIRFVDPAFFPCHTSLWRPGVVDDYYIAPLHWRSPSSYLPDDEKVRREVRLFRGPALHPDALHAGHFFPDSVFLSCVVGLACHCPAGLRSLFLHPRGAVEGRRERAVGAYRVELCCGGWWQSVVVDGFLPASATCPEFSHCADDLRLLWLPLLQKACAKLWGSYAASLNTPLEGVVGLLTGGPCCTLRELWPSRDDLRATSAKASRFFATLKRVLRGSAAAGAAGVAYLCWLRPYSLTTARTQDTRDKLEKLYADVGLAPGTAAVVLGLETLEDGQCLVRLRQSVQQKRSAEEWLAVWRAAKKPWVDSVSDLVFALDDAQGTVWMALEDVPQYFQSGYLAPLTADWAAAKVPGTFASRRPSRALRVEVTAPTRVLLTVTQAESTADKLKSTLSNITTAAEKDKSSAVRTDAALAGLSCLCFAKGAAAADDVLRFVGSNSDSADAFELSSTPHFSYERDVSLGTLLDPQGGPYYFVPCVHVNSLDVAYTLTVQAKADASAAKKTAAPLSAETTLTVEVVEVQKDAPLFQNVAKPSLRSSSIIPCESPIPYQTRPLNGMRVERGQGTVIELDL